MLHSGSNRKERERLIRCNYSNVDGQSVVRYRTGKHLARQE
jgi:hypothetical protein